MTSRQRFLQTMTFGCPDRPASGDYFYYDSTRARWEREGLPRGVDLNGYFAMDFDPFRWRVEVNAGILPAFAPQILEQSAAYRVERRASGAVVRVLEHTPPPAMPQWLRYPLTSRREWHDYRRRLDPETPGRLPANLAQLAAESPGRSLPLGMWVGGTYGFLRDWWGVEALSLLLYDDPGLVEEMIATLTHLSVTLFERVVQAGVQLDWVCFWEDMACKHGSLVSPAAYTRYCLPFYRAMVARIHSAGIPVVMLDSDGNIAELIPLWLDAGVPIMHPLECASGMDVATLRRQYGRRIGFFGGIDKRCLAGTREQIRAEVTPKLEACFADGGFIAACDHAIPPDVSFDNYRYYRDLVMHIGSRS